MTLRKLLLFFVSILLFSGVSKNNTKIIDFNLICKDLNSFIIKAKEESVMDGKYNVYALNFTTDNKGICVTFGFFSYIFNLSDFKKFKYYFYLNDDLIIVKYPNALREKYTLMNANFKPLKDRKLIYKKVSEEPFLGTHRGLVCCYYDNEIVKKSYDSDEFIPKDKAIFFYKNEGKTIEIDSVSFLESLKKKN